MLEVRVACSRGADKACVALAVMQPVTKTPPPADPLALLPTNTAVSRVMLEPMAEIAPPESWAALLENVVASRKVAVQFWSKNTAPPLHP